MSNEAKKYELIESESIVHNGRTLYRIRALKDFVTVNGEKVYKDDIGGFVESENNLSQEGNCWIFNNAKVYDNAVICDDALISGSAVVSQRAKVFNKAIVYGNAKIYDNAYVYGNAQIFENAEIYDEARVYGNAKVLGKAEIGDYSQVYENAIVNSAAWVFGNAKVYGNAKICEKAHIFGNAEVKGNAYICGDALVWGTAKISSNKKFKTGKYIVKSLDVDEALNEIKPICDKIDFVSKAINSNFPVEEDYVKSLISQFAEYNELADFFYISNIGFTSKGEKEIFELLLQSREMCKKIKVKIDK